MPKIPEHSKPRSESSCALCALTKTRNFPDVDIMPEGSMSIVRESPTAAIVKFKAGSIQPSHHHTFGHDLLVVSGSKRVWNLTKNQCFDFSQEILPSVNVSKAQKLNLFCLKANTCIVLHEYLGHRYCH